MFTVVRHTLFGLFATLLIVGWPAKMLYEVLFTREDGVAYMIFMVVVALFGVIDFARHSLEVRRHLSSVMVLVLQGLPLAGVLATTIGYLSPPQLVFSLVVSVATVVFFILYAHAEQLLKTADLAEEKYNQHHIDD